jgi:hypothetical protein
VADPVDQDGMKAGIAKDDFGHALGCRISLENRPDVFAKIAEHGYCQ